MSRFAKRVRVLSLLLSLLPVVGMAKGLEQPLIFVQEPLEPTACGSRIAALQPDGDIRLLTEGFCAAAEPTVSFDGRRVLFAGKLHAGENWDVWEMDVNGSRKMRVTSDMGDCREPVYLAMAAVDAPNFRDKVRWIAFTSTASDAIDEQGRGPLASLYAMSLTPVPGRGTVVWRTGYNLGGDLAPTTLADGRVLFSSWQRQGFALMTISWAGENLNPFFGSHDKTTSQLSACELPGERLLVFVEGEGDAEDRSGRLAQVSFRRPLNSYRALSRGEGRYRTPQGLADGRLLVAYARGGDSYGIYLFDEKKGMAGKKVFDAADWHDVDPQPAVARPEPIGRIPMVEFASVLDVGGFKEAGQLQCLNVYESDREESEQVRPGEAKKVRLVEGLPLTLEEGQRLLRKQERGRDDGAWPPPFVATRSLGEAPVEEDGSFYVNVAGNVPFYVEILDGKGEVVTAMRSWMWVRSGDQRGCIGCHEDKEMAPENRVTEALVKAQPTMLLGPRRQGKGE
ncbi:MAG: hypothetical protein HOC74_09475 [Gemmatimonadetes bacterium]|jgi:hypothetical protein|nr:hypothetical protein [Gemmatimonadota bacterium]